MSQDKTTILKQKMSFESIYISNSVMEMGVGGVFRKMIPKMMNSREIRDMNKDFLNNFKKEER